MTSNLLHIAVYHVDQPLVAGAQRDAVELFCLAVLSRRFGSRVWRDTVPAANKGPGSWIGNRLQALAISPIVI